VDVVDDDDDVVVSVDDDDDDDDGVVVVVDIHYIAPIYPTCVRAFVALGGREKVLNIATVFGYVKKENLPYTKRQIGDALGTEYVIVYVIVDDDVVE